MGESGSGKTTIGRAIAGLNRISGGSLKVLGHEMLGFKERNFKKVRQDIGFVFQDPAASFNPQLTIGECVAEPLLVHTVARCGAAARKRVDELLEAVQLPRRVCRTASRTSSPAGSASAPRWPGRWRLTRSC